MVNNYLITEADCVLIVLFSFGNNNTDAEDLLAKEPRAWDCEPRWSMLEPGQTLVCQAELIYCSYDLQIFIVS